MRAVLIKVLHEKERRRLGHLGLIGRADGERWLWKWMVPVKMKNSDGLVTTRKSSLRSSRSLTQDVCYSVLS